MAKLDVDKIEVVKEQEWYNNGDELYFTVNGTKVETTQSLKTGDSYLFPYKPINFTGTATVRLYEDDPSLNPDEYIDVAYIPDTAKSWNETFSGAGGVYDAWFYIG